MKSRNSAPGATIPSNATVNTLKKEISKLVKYELKYEELWSVFLLNAASSDETREALTYSNFSRSCCIHPKLVSAPLFLMVENLFRQSI